MGHNALNLNGSRALSIEELDAVGGGNIIGDAINAVVGAIKNVLDNTYCHNGACVTMGEPTVTPR